MSSNIFPVELLKECSSALSLFSAAYYGRQDVHFIYEAGIKECMMVDIDRYKLKVMQGRTEFDYYCGDAFQFIDNCSNHYDIVITDQYTQHDEEIYKRLEKLKQIAKKYVVMGISQNFINIHKLDLYPLIKRTDFKKGVYWYVIRK